MKSISAIKNRIRSVNEIANITGAMQLISVAKLRKANDKFQKNQVYYESVKDTMRDILIHTKEKPDNVYFIPNGIKTVAYLVITSDAGMVGDYNHRVLHYAKGVVGCDKTDKIYVVGDVAKKFFKQNKIAIAKNFENCIQNPTLEDARKIGAELLELYDNKAVEEIRVIHTIPSSKGNSVVNDRLLPILKDDFDVESVDDDKDGLELSFEPNPKQVFEILVEQYLIGQIFSYLVQAVKCEHTERIEAMSKATKNAQEMIEDLELQYFRARQEQITTELAEISGGNSAKL